MTLKIIITEPEFLSPQVAQILDACGEITTGPFDRSVLKQAVKDADILFIRLAHKIDRELIDAGKNLKIIATSTTGLDHIDTDYGAEKNIKILSLRGETEFLKTVTATAELSWGLLLSLTRRIDKAAEHVKQGHWQRNDFMGHELSGKTIAIIGCGRLGAMVKKYAEAFSMNVLIHDPYIENENLTPFEECLQKADIVSLHVPLNDETHHMIGAEEFALMKSESLLINTSRGAVVESSALLRALEGRQIAGAALDVIEGEEQGFGTMEANPLMNYAKKNNNLIITPHIGGLTHESLEKAERFMAEKVKNACAA